ncbi:MAG TPA: immunity 22 family protein [Longimicrobium sp.]|nr:immunity 22 family protein [Longimicrobium sp.]
MAGSLSSVSFGSGGKAVDSVHVFISTGRFRSFGELRAYVDETYNEDGDGVPSAFMREAGLSEYEPGCIEAIPSECGSPVPLSRLLAGASYSGQWLPRLDGARRADAAICVFAPNRVEHPGRCSLEYLGAFEYRVAHPEGFEQLLRGEAPNAEPGAAPGQGGM